MILKRIYQEVIVDHKSREVKFCGWLYGSREKVKARIDRRVEHLSRGVTLRDEIEDFGGGHGDRHAEDAGIFPGGDLQADGERREAVVGLLRGVARRDFII